MAKYSVLQTFYSSDTWRTLRLVMISQRGLKCQYCGQRVAHAEELTLHHKIELTPDNVNDANISLNPDNLLLVHSDCHNQIHPHASRAVQRQVFIVFGPPLAGKKTFVRERMWPGDMVVDMDALYAAMTLMPWYVKPDSLLHNVKAVHNLLLDNIRTRYGRWDRAWIIGGYADKWKREKLAEDIGAELVLIQATKEQCITRLLTDPDRHNMTTEWTRYIDKWFDEYTA